MNTEPEEVFLTQEEWYRQQERLGILCGSGPMNPEAEKMAMDDAMQFRDRVNREAGL